MPEPNLVPEFWRGGSNMTVLVYLDDEPKANGGASYEAKFAAHSQPDLDKLLRLVCTRWCPEHRVRVAIFDPVKDKWVHPGGYIMPEDWDGLVELKLQCLAGSYHL